MKTTTIAFSMIVAAASVSASSEVIYLSNCDNAPEGDKHSEMDYYSDISASQNGQTPGDNNRARLANYWVTWENNNYVGTFPTGVKFNVHINQHADNLATGQYAGDGNNGKPWTCYKDNGRNLFNDVSTCHSIYYCRPS